MSDQKSEKKYRNLSKKYKIDRDDFEAQFERLTRYILQTYNFGSELVTIAYLDLLRNGDIPESAEGKKASGMYRREIGEEGKCAEKAIGKPSDLIRAAFKRVWHAGKNSAYHKRTGRGNDWRKSGVDGDFQKGASETIFDGRNPWLVSEARGTP